MTQESRFVVYPAIVIDGNPMYEVPEGQTPDVWNVLELVEEGDALVETFETQEEAQAYADELEQDRRYCFALEQKLIFEHSDITVSETKVLNTAQYHVAQQMKQRYMESVKTLSESGEYSQLIKQIIAARQATSKHKGMPDIIFDDGYIVAITVKEFEDIRDN